MSEKEFEMIAAAIKASYPNANVLPDKFAMRLWYEMLCDLDYSIAQNAVKEHISVSPFPPKIADIRQKCADRMVPQIGDWGEAWGEVEHAIRYFGYMREKEALESMSEITRKVVRRMGWRNICMSENVVADRAHFSQIYDILAKRMTIERQMPIAVAAEKAQLIQRIKPNWIETEEKSSVEEVLENKRASGKQIDIFMQRFKQSI